MNTAQDTIDRIAAPLMGRAVSAIERGIGSMLMIDFGERPEGASRAEWHLWVYNAEWRFFDGGQLVIGSGDTADDIEEALATLETFEISAITIHEGGDTTVEFGRDRRLEILGVGAPSGEDEWMLFTPDATVFSLGSGRWQFGPSGVAS